MEFDRTLGVGARGGHGPIRYFIEEYVPGESIKFRFTGPKGFNGFHGYERIKATANTAVLRHTLEMKNQKMKNHTNAVMTNCSLSENVVLELAY